MSHETFRVGALLSISLMLISGCASQQVAIEGRSGFAVAQEQIPAVAEEYRLQVGDRVSIVCVQNEQARRASAYRISAGDVISVVVHERNDLSRDYRVGPDGGVQLIRLPVIPAGGMTMAELRQRLQEEYRRSGVDNFISVSLMEYDRAAEEFIRDLSPGVTGRDAFTTTIAIDGYANFPLIGFVKLANLTLQEANEAVAKLYQTHFQTLDVTLRIEQSSSHSVAVLGEVLKPGAFPVSGPASVLTVLGSAGGYAPTAKLDSIMTVQRRGDKIYVNKFDLEHDLFAMANHMMIAGDFIFIPKSSVANANQFIDQYIRRNLPFNFGLSATYDLR